MMGERDGAVARAAQHFDSGAFATGLARLVAHPTQSQLPNAHAALADYFDSTIGPDLTGLRFTTCRSAAGRRWPAHRPDLRPC